MELDEPNKLSYVLFTSHPLLLWPINWKRKEKLEWVNVNEKFTIMLKKEKKDINQYSISLSLTRHNYGLSLVGLRFEQQLNQTTTSEK